MSNSLTINLHELAEMLHEQGKKLPSLRQPLLAAKYLLENASKDCFHGSHDPEGKAWLPLKEPRKNGTTAPLWDSGRLANSVSGGAGHVEELSEAQLIWGTNVEYAAYQNYGTKHIPARPFIGVTDELAEKISRLFLGHLASHLAGD